MKSLIISLHDVAPATAEASRRWMELFEERNLGISLLVVPGPWRGKRLSSETSFTNWLNNIVGEKHEVVLHGWMHAVDAGTKSARFRNLSGNVMARGCQEFWNLDQAEAERRLKLGLETLRQFGHSPTGFIAPGWMASSQAKQATNKMGFEYTTTHLQICDFVTDRKHLAPVVCQRPNALTSGLIANATKALAKVLTTTSSTLRVAVHPDDIRDPRLRNAIFRIIDQAIAHGYTSLTYKTFVGSVRSIADTVSINQSLERAN
jgi:predicted deacetylase